MSKKKKNKGAEAPEAGTTGVSVVAHPRARASVRRTRARTALDGSPNLSPVSFS